MTTRTYLHTTSARDGAEVQLRGALNHHYANSGQTQSEPDKQNKKDKSAQGGGEYNIDNAVNWLNNNAHASWKDAKGQCGLYIRYALEAGFGLNKDALKGKTTDNTGYAKNMGPYLQKLGFHSINTTSFLKGDIAIIQSHEGGSSAGHAQMFNGSIWISDFKQERPFWPSGNYLKHQPSFQIYRRLKNHEF